MKRPTMTKQYKILVFTLDELACALNVSNVVRVIGAMEISNLPKAPEIIKGIIKIREQIIPVVDIRKRFGHLRREIEDDDRIIIADTGKRKVAFFADSVSEIKGKSKAENEMIIIHDLEQFLSFDEEKALEEALEEAFYRIKIEIPD